MVMDKRDCNTTTHAVGGGEWSIEVRDKYGNFVKEFVGSNGTQSPKEDLWARFDKWLNE